MIGPDSASDWRARRGNSTSLSAPACRPPTAPIGTLAPMSFQVPAASLQIETPHDPEARYGLKRELAWTGYKVHLTETCDDDRPHLLIQVETTVAPTADVESLASPQLLQSF